MTLLPPGVKVHLAFGYIDMRKGMDSLSVLVHLLDRMSGALDFGGQDPDRMEFSVMTGTRSA